MQTCPQCGAITPPSDIDAHPYFGASGGCWAIYGDILEREYSNPEFFANHRQTVDAYALQHPGNKEDLRAIQSVNIHLIALTILYKTHIQAPKIAPIMGKIINANKNSFAWLEPPESFGPYDVMTIWPLTERDAHLAGVDRWARNVWEAWEIHHDIAWEYIKAEGIS